MPPFGYECVPPPRCVATIVSENNSHPPVSVTTARLPAAPGRTGVLVGHLKMFSGARLDPHPALSPGTQPS
jgi:hypothetical protein